MNYSIDDFIDDIHFDSIEDKIQFIKDYALYRNDKNLYYRAKEMEKENKIPNSEREYKR